MKSTPRVFINTFWQVFSRVLVILVSLLTTGLLTRLFGSRGYGDYVFITSSVLFFVSLSDFGTTIIGVREAAKEKNSADLIFANILGLRIIFTLVLFSLFNLLILSLPQFSGLRLATFLASFVLFFLVLRTNAQAILQTYLRLDLASFLETFASFVFLTFLFLAFFTQKFISLSLLMAFWSISAFFSGILGLVISRKYLPIKLYFQKQEFLRIFREAYPLGLSLLIYSVYDRGIDSFMIKTFFTSQEVGYYGLAYKIHGNLILGAAFLMNSLFPLISAFNANLADLKPVLQKIFTLFLLSGLLILLIGFPLSSLIIRIIAGPEFFPSVLVLRILLLATFFSYLNHLTGYSLIAFGRQKTLFHFSLIGLLVNLVLNFCLIPRFSIIAAAGVTVLTEATLFVLTFSHLRRKLGLTIPMKDFINNAKLLLTARQKYFDNYGRN